MSKLYDKYKVLGDKENSQFFNEYLPKIFDRRESSGIDDLLIGMRGIVVQVDTGDALKYMMELYLMTPYRFTVGYTCATHRAYILQVKPEYPAYIILEPTNKEYYDEFSAVDSLYPRAKEKHNVRYIGEIYHSKNALDTAKILTTHEIRFQDPNEIKNAFLKNKNFYATTLSYFTNNCVIYTNNPMQDFDSLELGEKFDLSADEKDQLSKVNEVHIHFGLDKLVFGIDHMATRVLCNEREHAILEFLCMSNYYFWGAYNIEDSNSSTNICRNPSIDYELKSPAKVFTANNTPFYVTTINGLPSPTEDFVRNLGKRMHHIAYEVADGAREDGTKNIDYVVEKLISEKIPFLAQVIGECRDFPDLKQIFSKSSPHSFLITEYVQRCQGFAGFFTKTNVGYLTKAAGEDEKLAKKATFS
ncbi:MAG: hypothetical protein AAB373_04235 [Patescibacteria group bacterium]